MIPYGLIMLVASIGLSGKYLFVSESSRWSKILVAGLLLVSLGWSHGFFLQAAVGIVLAIYFKYIR